MHFWCLTLDSEATHVSSTMSLVDRMSMNIRTVENPNYDLIVYPRNAAYKHDSRVGDL